MKDDSIFIRIGGREAEEDLRSLCDWLRNEPDVSHHARIWVASAEPRPGEMGAPLDAVQLVVDGSFQALSLALAYASWRGTRPGQPEVTIEGHGIKVILDGADPDTVGKIVRALPWTDRL
jgi:hypothetical protein